ncbi:hypothetical protein MASR2M70_01760 [Bacillota bacterium]
MKVLVSHCDGTLKSGGSRGNCFHQTAVAIIIKDSSLGSECHPGFDQNKSKQAGDVLYGSIEKFCVFSRKK